MRAAHKDTAAVQPEISIDDAKIPEPEIGGSLVRALDACGLISDREPIQIWVLNIPQPMVLDFQFVIHDGFPGLRLHFSHIGHECLPNACTVHSKAQTRTAGFLQCIQQSRADPNLTGTPVGANVEIRNADRGGENEFH